MNMKFKDKLRALRKRRGLSRKELAERAGLSIHTVEGYEQGIREPRYDTLERLAEALEEDPMELVGSIPKYLSLMNRGIKQGMTRLFPELRERSLELIKTFAEDLSHREMMEKSFPDRFDEEISSQADVLMNALVNLQRPGRDPEYLEPYGDLVSSVETQSEWEDAVREDAARDAREAIDRIVELYKAQRNGRA